MAFCWVHFSYAIENNLNIFLQKPITSDALRPIACSSKPTKESSIRALCESNHPLTASFIEEIRSVSQYGSSAFWARRLRVKTFPPLPSPICHPCPLPRLRCNQECR